ASRSETNSQNNNESTEWAVVEQSETMMNPNNMVDSSTETHLIGLNITNENTVANALPSDQLGNLRINTLLDVSCNGDTAYGVLHYRHTDGTGIGESNENSDIKKEFY